MMVSVRMIFRLVDAVPDVIVGAPPAPNGEWESIKIWTLQLPMRRGGSCTLPLLLMRALKYFFL